jgi:hypothetical protein
MHIAYFTSFCKFKNHKYKQLVYWISSSSSSSSSSLVHINVKEKKKSYIKIHKIVKLFYLFNFSRSPTFGN